MVTIIGSSSLVQTKERERTPPPRQCIKIRGSDRIRRSKRA